MNILKAAAFLKSARSRQKAGGEARGARQEAGGRRQEAGVNLSSSSLK